jgi:hypothetical protein
VAVAVHLGCLMSEAAALEPIAAPEYSESSDQFTPTDLAITETNDDYANAVPDTTQATQALVDTGMLPELELTGFADTGTTAPGAVEGLSWPSWPDIDFPEFRNPFEKPPETVQNNLKELTPEQMRQEIKDMGLASEQVPGNPPTTVFYTIGEGGYRVPVLQTNETTIEGQYKALIQERDRLIADTEQKYGVDILTGGTRDMFGKTQTLRPPNLTELYVLRDSLQNSEPSQTKTGKQLQIGYTVGDLPDGVLGVYTEADQPSIIIGTNKQQDYGSRLLTLNHELAHSGQYNSMHSDKNYEDKLASASGYRNVNGMWLIEGENPGEFYRTVSDQRLFEYVRVNEKGEMLRADGTVTTNLEEVKILKAEDVRNLARVRPVTEYFPTPVEANAEALAYYRTSEDRRWGLMMNDPELYDATKRLDQAEIDRKYGRNSDGSSKYIRALTGELVENNAQNREIIKVWEDANRKEAELVRAQPNEAMPTAFRHGHSGAGCCSL